MKKPHVEELKPYSFSEIMATEYTLGTVRVFELRFHLTYKPIQGSLKIEWKQKTDSLEFVLDRFEEDPELITCGPISTRRLVPTYKQPSYESAPVPTSRRRYFEEDTNDMCISCHGENALETFIVAKYTFEQYRNLDEEWL